MTETFANLEVLDFYKSLPFNYGSSPAMDARALSRTNHVPYVTPGLEELLKGARNVLDVGCGAGWLSNSMAHYYRTQVLGIDFNPVAVARAQAVAKILGCPARFQVADLFLFAPPEPYDLICSVGVLHHTDNCLEGLRRICGLLRPGGSILVGLYHLHGRKPFLGHFREMQAAGKSEDEMFRRYRELDPRHADDMLARSWFRDQVLHPHETQHTLAEVLEVFTGAGMELTSTSINRYAPFVTPPELLDAEPSLEAEGRRALAERRYYPGFFTAVGRRTE